MNTLDEHFMRLALREAWKGRGTTSPNPMVGAVLVAHEKVLSRGYHRAAGQPHAEIEALRNLPSPSLARRATLYVTLEPCSTTGRTPPCTQSIIDAGITRVVYGATDPNPHHQGRAQQLLKQAGIEVTTDVLAAKCTYLNHAWNHRMKTGMPWVIAKCAMSLDGRISSHPDQRWITSEATRHHAMLFRRNVDAILVGGNTVRTDNPHLTVRNIQGNATKKIQPWRVIWSPSGNVPKESHLLTDGHSNKTILLQHSCLQEALCHLSQEGISSVLIEGGGQTLGEAFKENLVDEVRFYMAPTIMGGNTLALQHEKIVAPLPLAEMQYRFFDDDVMIRALLVK